MANHTGTPSVVLICHEDNQLDRLGLASWIAGALHLAGLIVIRDGPARLLRKGKREIRLRGWRHFADVLAFRLYAALSLSRSERRWERNQIRTLRNRFPIDITNVPMVIVENP